MKDAGGCGNKMSNDELRINLILEIVHRLKVATGCKFEREFYKKMMEAKGNGNNLWVTQGEEDFYRRLCRGIDEDT